MNSAASQIIGDYRLLKRLGAGGMGEVFLAEDVRVGRPVAIKVLTAARSPDFAQRFRNEARIHQRLYHPNIAALFETAETSSGPALVMEYVGGPALMDWAEGPPRRGWLERLEAFCAIARAVGYLHAQGIVHRDIKPENVKMAEDGKPKLLDFGIARDARTPGLTVTGNYIGTLQYSAPERLAGHPADLRSDAWSLGILLYELLTGRPPFAGANITDLLSRIRKCQYEPLKAFAPGLPDECDRLIEHSVAVEPAARFDSGGAFAIAAEEVLARAQGRGSGNFAPNSASRHPWRRVDRKGSAWVVSLLAAAAALASVAVMLFGGDEPTPPAQTFPTRPDLALVPPVVETEPVRVPIRIGSFSGTHELYDRSARKIGVTPYESTTAYGSNVWIECRRNGQPTEPPLEFQAGLRNFFNCSR